MELPLIHYKGHGNKQFYDYEVYQTVNRMLLVWMQLSSPGWIAIVLQYISVYTNCCETALFMIHPSGLGSQRLISLISWHGCACHQVVGMG